MWWGDFSISHFDICYETKKQTNIRMNKSLLSCNICGEEIFLFPTFIFVMKQRNKQTSEWTSPCSPVTSVVRISYGFPISHIDIFNETNKYQNKSTELVSQQSTRRGVQRSECLEPPHGQQLWLVLFILLFVCFITNIKMKDRKTTIN